MEGIACFMTVMNLREIGIRKSFFFYFDLNY